jgi:hypothetical protein
MGYIWSAAIQGTPEQQIIPREWAVENDGARLMYRPFVGHAYAQANPYNGAPPAPCVQKVIPRG